MADPQRGYWLLGELCNFQKSEDKSLVYESSWCSLCCCKSKTEIGVEDIFRSNKIVMGRKCCVFDCKTGYDSQKKAYIDNGGKKISVFRFPTEKKEPEDRKRWIDIVSKVNANLTVNKDTVVCEAHWPKGYPTYRKKGHDKPAVPPSIFPESIPDSIVPEPLPAPRVTQRTSNHERNTLPDELQEFEEMDKFSFSQLQEELVDQKSRYYSDTTCFMNNGYNGYNDIHTVHLLFQWNSEFSPYTIGYPQVRSFSSWCQSTRPFSVKKSSNFN